MNDIIERIGLAGIIPVVKLKRAEDALPLAKALCAGGICAAEITFRTDCAAAAIAEITREIPNMLIGAGTVLTTAQVDEAVAAGAKFIVSPGLNPEVVRRSMDRGVTVIPGCATPTEVERAISLGLDTVKFFPAEAAGGIDMIKAMAAPYSSIKFMPTGGIGENNLNEYLACDNVLACGGSWMVREQLIDSGEFAKITELAHSALMKMFGFGIKHIGVNAPDEATAKRSAMIMTTMFGFEPRDAGGAIFTGELFEFMKYKFHGSIGHIGIATNDLRRAVAYFKSMGFTFIEDEFKFDADGRQISAAYFTGEFFGYAIHLIAR